MKTTTSTFSFKGLVISAVVAGSLTLGVLAQPNSENNPEVPSYYKQLENFVNSSEKMLIYKAPDEGVEEKQLQDALNRLDLISLSIDESLKYTAPVKMEDQNIQNLDQLAALTMDQLKYSAPEETEEIAAQENEMLLSNSTNGEAHDKIDNDSPSMQESWLINAGYVKSSGRRNHF